jgi:hypothetical protein
MVVGAGIGVWMVLKVQEAAAKLTPSGALDEARRRVRHVGNDLTAALAEGKRAKRATEAELRQQARTRPAIDVASGPALSLLQPADLHVRPPERGEAR